MTDYDWPAVVGNLIKACRQRAQLPRVLGREGEDAQTSGLFYVAILKATLLFGSETWEVTPRMVQTVGFFHHRVARHFTGKIP